MNGLYAIAERMSSMLAMDVLRVSYGRGENVPEPTFGAWSQRQLERREWTQSDLSRRSGISHGRISDWVRDVRLPNPDSCDKLADALGIELDEVLARAG